MEFVNALSSTVTTETVWGIGHRKPVTNIPCKKTKNWTKGERGGVQWYPEDVSRIKPESICGHRVRGSFPERAFLLMVVVLGTGGC